MHINCMREFNGGASTKQVGPTSLHHFGPVVNTGVPFESQTGEASL